MGSSGRISSEDSSPAHHGAASMEAADPLASYDTQAQGLPTYDYPSPFVVRNTFIEAPLGGLTSLLGSCYREREIRSCPNVPPGLLHTEGGSLAGPPPGFEDAAEPCSALSFMQEAAVTETPPASAFEDVAHLEQIVRKLQEENRLLKANMQPGGTLAPQLDNLATTRAQETAAVAPAAFAVVGAGPAPPAPVAWAPVLPEAMPPPPPSVPADSFLQPRVLEIACALPEPMLGSPMWPSVGSACHQQGTCKPCAHFHKKGCANGPQCSFCHLCPPGEIKRRQSRKKAHQF